MYHRPNSRPWVRQGFKIQSQKHNLWKKKLKNWIERKYSQTLKDLYPEYIKKSQNTILRKPSSKVGKSWLAGM